jgi:hypothetical protein
MNVLCRGLRRNACMTSLIKEIFFCHQKIGLIPDWVRIQQQPGSKSESSKMPGSEFYDFRIRNTKKDQLFLIAPLPLPPFYNIFSQRNRFFSFLAFLNRLIINGCFDPSRPTFYRKRTVAKERESWKSLVGAGMQTVLSLTHALDQ